MNWKEKLIRFMYGRYGVDTMWYGLVGLAILLAICNLILRMPLIHILQSLILVYAIACFPEISVPDRRKMNISTVSGVK